MIHLKERQWLRRSSLLILGMCVLAPLVLEAGFRSGIFLGIPYLKRPELYADEFSDDDFWILRRLWEKRWMPSPERIHPLLGWSQARITDQNPLGLEKEALSLLRSDGRHKILFYGDSFVKGESDLDHEIPRYLDHRLDHSDVVDLGVVGYGTDQIFLLLKATYFRVERPFLIVGVLTRDLDRAILTVRDAQKPFFRVDKQGELILKGVPVEKDQEAYFRREAGKMRSYFLGFLWTRIRRFFPDRQAEKEMVTSKIIEKIKSLSDERDLRLLFVLFYNKGTLKVLDWREIFLKGEFERMGISYIDTKLLLLTHASDHGLPLSAFYRGESGHHNDLGNQVIGDAILAYLKRVGLS